MTEEFEPNIDSLIRIWAPDAQAQPQQYEAMCKLVAMGDSLTKLLQSNGVTSAEIMPPYARGGYVPDEDDGYEIFAAPTTLKLEVEGNAVYEALLAATGLVGWFNNPYQPAYRFKLALAENGLTLLHSIKMQIREAS